MELLGLQVTFALRSYMVGLQQLQSFILYPPLPEQLNLGFAKVGVLAQVPIENSSEGQPWAVRAELVELALDCSRAHVDPGPLVKQVLIHFNAKILGSRVLGNDLPSKV